MASKDSFGAKSTLDVEGKPYEIYRLDAVTGEGLDVASLPFSLKVLLENLLRTEDGADITADDIKALAGWDADAEPDKEIQFTPARVIMQDFTGVPCVVDLATMREAMAELGGDASRINPLAPAEMVIDHSVIADVFGTPEAFERNVEIEYERNRERYQFLRWGQGAFSDFKVVPPGTGIVHQVNIEHLARVVFTREVDGIYRRLPRHLRRHRLPHHDGQRHRRGRLGRRRHRGRGRDARPAGVDADPAGGRLQAQRRPPRGRHRHRPGPHDHRDAAPARRRRQVRRVLRPGRLRPPARQPGHDRQHEPGVRLDHRGLPDRRADHRLPPDDRPHARSSSPWSRPTPRSRASGTTPTPSRATPSGSSSTWRPSYRRSPARSVRRTGSRSPTPRRPSGRRWPTTSTREGEESGYDEAVAESFPASDSPSHEHGNGRRRPTSWSPPRRPTGAGRQQPGHGHPRGRHEVRDRPRRGDDRRDHVVHQHLQPVGDDRRRAAGEEGGREGPVSASPGSRPRWPPAPRWSRTTTRRPA